jgi:serine/threonine protein kinase
MLEARRVSMQCGGCGSTLAPDIKICPDCGQKTPEAAVSVANGTLPQAGTTFAGRYRVEKYLGLGSLCNAYLCRDLAAGNREVVLKILHARKAAEAGMAESFLFLAESVSRYQYKGIAKIYEFGRHEGLCYYTMEWIPGIPLRLWLLERLNFDNRVLPGLGILHSLLETFEVIHDRGCYGCLKPENIFITLQGPVVMDFGVVGFLSPQEFEFNAYARRYIPYMAPELRQDWSNLLPHSDYYSLGAILYEILVGRVPVSQLRLPSELSSIFNIEADEVVLKSMAAKPLDRFSTLDNFKKAIASLQGNLLSARTAASATPTKTPASILNQGPTPNPGPTVVPELDTNPKISPSHFAPDELRSQSHLDATSDVQAVHNPDLSFFVPENIVPPAMVQHPPMTETKPQDIQDPIPEKEEANMGAQTVFFPKPTQAEPPRVLSDFAEQGNRNAEAAHVQRRFSNSAFTPLPAPTQDVNVPLAIDSNLDWDDVEAEPVPTWVWAVLGLVGIGLVALSAYFGMQIRF